MLMHVMMVNIISMIILFLSMRMYMINRVVVIVLMNWGLYSVRILLRET
jgi:hypothetical protein